MTDRQLYEVTNLDRYGSAPLPWTRPHDLLHKGALGPEGRVFLGTAGAGGVPHAAGIGVAGLDGDLYLTSGSHTASLVTLHPVRLAQFPSSWKGSTWCSKVKRQGH